MEEKYIVFEDKLHEYNIFVTRPNDHTTVYSLYTSNAEHWTDSNKEKFKISITDNGEDIICSKAVKSFNYSQWGELRILMDFEHHLTKSVLPNNYDGIKIMKVENEITI